MDYAGQKGSVKGAGANVDIYRSAGKAIHFLYIYAFTAVTSSCIMAEKALGQCITRISRKKIPRSVFGK